MTKTTQRPTVTRDGTVTLDGQPIGKVLRQDFAAAPWMPITRTGKRLPGLYFTKAEAVQKLVDRYGR